MVPYLCPDDYSMSLNEAAAYIETVTGRRPSKATLHRWAQKGTRGIKLEASRLGGRFYTCRRAVDAFIVATNSAARQPVSLRQPERPSPLVTQGLHGRVSDRQVAVAVSSRASDHAQAKQYLDRELNLMKFLLLP